MTHTKTYLGDGVYADFDGYCLVLTTEDGVSAQNIIVLEPEVYRALTQMRAPTAETRVVELEQELNDVSDALGIAGVGEPISLWQAAQSLRERATAAERALDELIEVLRTVAEGLPRTNPPGVTWIGEIEARAALAKHPPQKETP